MKFILLWLFQGKKENTTLNQMKVVIQNNRAAVNELSLILLQKASFTFLLCPFAWLQPKGHYSKCPKGITVNDYIHLLFMKTILLYAN